MFVVRVFLVVLAIVTAFSFLLPWYWLYQEVIEIPEENLLNFIRFPSASRTRNGTHYVKYFFTIATTPEEFQQRFLVRKQLRQLKNTGVRYA